MRVAIVRYIPVLYSFDRCFRYISFTIKLFFFCRYNSTILAYGQTGSGKSFTMQEDPDHIGMQEGTKLSESYRNVEDPDPAKPVQKGSGSYRYA
jgi:hypothetical protein